MIRILSHFILIMSLLFSSTSMATDACPGIFATLFRAKSKIEKFSDFEYLRAIDRLERLNNRLRNFRDPSIPAQTLKTNKRLVKVDSFILTGDVHTAERELAPLFRKVEMSYLIATRNQKLIDHLEGVETMVDWDKVKTLGFESEQIELWKESLGAQVDSVAAVKELVRQRNNSLVELGLHYHDYRIFREHLDQLTSETNCKPECVEAVRHLISDLGIHSEKEKLRFPRILAGAQRPSLEDIRASVHGSKLASIVRLRKERNAEIVLALKALLKKSTLFDVISKKLAALPGLYETRLIRLFKSFYDQHARELFFPEMNRLLRMDLKEIEELLKELKKINAKFEGDEFLVNLSRRIDGLAKDFWAALKEQAVKSDNSFLERMLKAEKTGNQKGGLSLTPSPSLLNKFTLVLLAGGGVVYFTLSPRVEVSEVSSTEVEPESLQLSVFDEEAEKMLDELSKSIEENEEIFGSNESDDLGYLTPVWPGIRLPASGGELESPPGAFTRWFKKVHWSIRGRFLWR